MKINRIGKLENWKIGEIPHGVGNTWIKFQLSGNIFLIIMDFWHIQPVSIKEIVKLIFDISYYF